MHLTRTALVALVSMLFLSGCVFYPKTNVDYDSDCAAKTRRLVLEAEPIEHCPTSDASDCIASLLFVSAGSAIVSGSIIVVGNTVYWLEKKAQCMTRHSADA